MKLLLLIISISLLHTGPAPKCKKAKKTLVKTSKAIMNESSPMSPLTQFINL
ncbi:MAG: hypothetical protein JWP88_1150 [Flaviaesturariibacter sp.]|nr:hypothetical protein [Flaviaesturariibacter sp.]